MGIPVLSASDILATIALGLAAFALILFSIVLFRQSRLLKRYRALLNGPQGADLDLLLANQATQIHQLTAELQAMQAKVTALELAGERHFSRIGIVRFNPFPEMGSDLSFAVALLDSHHNGVVISSLYSRQESRVYAKPILDGKSTYTLTDEEREAIAKACK